MAKPTLIRIHDGLLSSPLGTIRLPKEVKWIDQFAIDTKAKCIAISGATHSKEDGYRFPKATLFTLHLWHDSKWKKITESDFFIQFGMSGTRLYFSDSSWLYVSDAASAPERLVKCGIKSGGCPFSVNRSGTRLLAHTMQWKKGPIYIDIKSKRFWELGQYGLWNVQWLGNHLSSYQNRDFTVYKDHAFEDILYHADDLIAESTTINASMAISPTENQTALFDVIPSGQGAYFSYFVNGPKFEGAMRCLNHIDTSFKITHIGLFSSQTYHRTFVAYGKSGFAQRSWEDNTLVFPDGSKMSLQQGEFVVCSPYSPNANRIGLNL